MIAVAAGVALEQQTINRFSALSLVKQMQMTTTSDVFVYYKETIAFYKKNWPNFKPDAMGIKNITAADLIICSFLNKQTVLAGLAYLGELEHFEYHKERQGLMILGIVRALSEGITPDLPLKEIIESATLEDLECLKVFITSNTFWKAIEQEFNFVKDEHT